MPDEKKVNHVCMISCGVECLYVVISAVNAVEGMKEARRVAGELFPKFKRKRIRLCEVGIERDFKVRIV